MIAFTSWNFRLVAGAWCDNSRDNNSENFSSTSGRSAEWYMVAAEKNEADDQTRKGARTFGSRERPSIAQCREICRDLHGRLASLAPRERTSERAFPLFSFSGIIPWSTKFPPLRLPWSCYPLTPAWAGVACRIKKAFGEIGIPVSAWAMQNRTSMRLLPALLFTHEFCSSFFSFFPFFFITHSIDDIRFPEKLVYPSLCKNHYLTIY